MIELLLASMIFATVPALEAPIPTVYAEPAIVVESAVEHEVSLPEVAETSYYCEETKAEECNHGVYEDIIDLGGGCFVGICECGAEVRWYESDGSDLVDDEEIPIEWDEDEEVPEEEEVTEYDY